MELRPESRSSSTKVRTVNSPCSCLRKLLAIAFSVRRSMRVLPKKDRQEYSQDQSEKPQRRRRCSYLTDPAQFAGRKFRIKGKPAGVSALQQKKGQGSHSAINQVAHEGRQKRRSGISAPVADTGKHKRQKGHGSEIPTDQAKQPAPPQAQTETRSLISKEQSITRADQGADEQMDQQTPKKGKAAAQSCNFRQYSGGKHHRTRDQTTHEASQSSPADRTQDMNAGSFGFPIKRIALNEQPNPHAVQGGIGDAEDQPIEDMPNKRTEEVTAVCRPPVERSSGGDG